MTSEEKPKNYNLFTSSTQAKTPSGNQNVLNKLLAQDAENKRILRIWWQQSVLANSGQFKCCAFVLALPSDTEAIRYLTEFGSELELLSGDNCLVLFLTNDLIQSREIHVATLDPSLWSEAVDTHIIQGHSLKIAEYFEVSPEQFPCLILFEDIRSTKHTLIPLKGINAQEIADKMRRIFSAIQKAVSEKHSPLDAAKAQQKQDQLRETGKSLAQQVRSLAGKTFEKAVETVVEGLIKSSNP
jgi:hypothetical protein